MRCTVGCGPVLVLLAAVLSSASTRRGGWLERQFMDDFDKLPIGNRNFVRAFKRSPGSLVSEESIFHLISLIRDSGAPGRRSYYGFGLRPRTLPHDPITTTSPKPRSNIYTYILESGEAGYYSKPVKVWMRTA